MLTSLHGIWMPLATPMHHGEIDLPRLQNLAADLIDQGVHGLVVCGDDALLLAALCSGAHGAISASAHIRVDLFVQLYELVEEQRLPMTPATTGCKARIATMLDALDDVPAYSSVEAI